MRSFHLSIRPAAIFLALALTQTSASPQSQKTEGECSPNVIGNGNSIYCARRSGQPNRADALSQIKSGMSAPIYDILQVRYKNGYRESDDVYIVSSEIDVRLKIGCDDTEHLNRVVNPQQKKEGAFTTFAMGLAMLELFGTNCKAGDEYTLTRDEKFRYTENGWVLFNDKS